MLQPRSCQYPDLSEGADSVGGQLLGNRVPLQWRNQLWQSLEEESGTESDIRILGACVFSYLRSPKGRESGCRACERPVGFRVSQDTKMHTHRCNTESAADGLVSIRPIAAVRWEETSPFHMVQLDRLGREQMVQIDRLLEKGKAVCRTTLCILSGVAAHNGSCRTELRRSV